MLEEVAGSNFESSAEEFTGQGMAFKLLFSFFLFNALLEGQINFLSAPKTFASSLPLRNFACLVVFGLSWL